MAKKLHKPWGEGYVVDIFDLIREKDAYTAKIGAQLSQEFLLGMFQRMAEEVAQADLSQGRALFLFLRVIKDGAGTNYPEHSAEIVETGKRRMAFYHDSPKAALDTAKQCIDTMLNERHGIFEFRAGLPVPGGMKPTALFTWEWGAVKFDFGQVPLDPWVVKGLEGSHQSSIQP